MNRREFCTGAASLLALPGVLLTSGSTVAQWAAIAPGISYRQYTLEGPVNVYAARADRSVKSWTLDTMTSLGQIKGGRETVPDMAARYNDSITFDGHRYNIKVAINGDYFDMKTGVALSGQIISGWFAKRFGEYSGSGFVWTTDRRCFLGGNLRNAAKLQRVVFADGFEMKINQLNEPREAASLALYTPQFADNTGTADDGVEVSVRVEAPVSIMPAPPGVKGRIISIRQNAGSTRLLFDTVVLSANGSAAAELLRHAHVGEDVRITLELKDAGNPDIGLPAGDWHNAYASLGGPKCILVSGKVPKDWEAKAAKDAAEGRKNGSVIKDPRTAIAFDRRWIYFLVIDGRSEQSIGMTFTDAGNFCRDELKATDAVLLDGGGSSTLWVDGKVMNRPSGKPGQDTAGELRPVANGWFIAQVLPPKISDALRTGRKVTLSENGRLRLGPGPAYGLAGGIEPGKIGEVLPHSLNGVFAKGTYWWHCAFPGAEGWAAREQLQPAP